MLRRCESCLFGHKSTLDLKSPFLAPRGNRAAPGCVTARGRLTGRIKRGVPLPPDSRLHETARFGPPVDEERLYRVVDVLEEIAGETGRAVPQIALNWLIQRPTVASVIIGARNEAQLRQNLGGAGWALSLE